MIRGVWRLHREERGLAALLWVLGFTSLLAFFAIVVESGFIFVARRDLQNGVDAAALAGAQTLFLSQAADPEVDAVNAATGQTSKNVNGLTSNNAWVTDGVFVTANAAKDSGGVFSGSLSFAREVQASATARAASARLPGPGAFCVGVDTPSWLIARSAFEGDPSTSADDIDVTTLSAPILSPFLTELRLGSGAGSNAGYLAIDGTGANLVRDCFASGSVTPLEVTEPSETGIATGPALQGLQTRIEAATARSWSAGPYVGRGCLTWPDVRDSILWSRDTFNNPTQNWPCSPLEDQATTVILIPIVNEEFKNISGNTDVSVDGTTLGSDAPYLMSFYWIDKDQTFDTTDPNNWKFLTSGGQGQMVINGVFIFQHATTLGLSPGDGSGGIVNCDPTLDSTLRCFVQLVE